MKKTVQKSLPLAVVSIIALFLFLPQCISSDTNDEPSGSAASGLLNPERGWYIARETDNVSELRGFRNRGVSIVLLEANLKDYATRPMDSQKLREIEGAFDAARNAGLSVIFRAAYTYDNSDYEKNIYREPANIDLVITHIGQLGPVFSKNEDILFNVQAGFLGPWGEWHSSRFGRGKDLPASVSARQRVVDALLKAVPESVTIALRRPSYIRDYTGNSNTVTEGQAFGISPIARLAFHNDALMSDGSDMDTYADDAFPREAELGWVGRQTRYTPMVAETNLVSRYNNPRPAVTLLDRINMQSLNMEYHPNVLAKWRMSRYEGMSTLDYIGMMQGYRFMLKKADASADSGNLRLDFEVANVGFGHLLKEKKFEIVLKRGDQVYRAAIDEDARLWDKNETVSRNYLFSLPSGISEGDWEVYLALSSAFESLADNPAYAVRFANENIWDEGLGMNKIGTVYVTAVAGSDNALRQLKE